MRTAPSTPPPAAPASPALGSPVLHVQLLERFVHLANSDQHNHAEWQETAATWRKHHAAIPKRTT